MSDDLDLPIPESVNEVNSLIEEDDAPALPSIYKKSEKMDIVAEAIAIVASANAKALPERQVGRFEMMEVLSRSLDRTILNMTNPSQRAFTALREVSDFVNMATTGAKPKVAGVHTDLLPVGHPLSTQKHSFSEKDVNEVRAAWMSADPRIAEEFRPLVASAFRAPANSLEREYVMAKLEATSVTEVPREIILGLTAAADPYGGGNSFLARSARARAQRRDRKGRFAWMGGGARVWLGTFDGVSTLFRFCGYDSNSDSFDLEIFDHPTLGSGVFSVPASKVEAVKAILPDNYLDLPDARPTKVDRDLLVDPASLVRKDAPTGWTKVSSVNGVDTFRSADGWTAVRYPKASDAPQEESITRVRGANVDKSINPDAPVYHISRGSADGTVVDKPFASAQSWADTQALIGKYDKLAENGNRFNAEEARKIPEGWTQIQDKNKSDFILRDQTGRYEAISMAPQDNSNRMNAYLREAKKIQENPSLVKTFDGAKDFDGNLESLFRLEQVRGDGTREVVGYYQDLEDIERDTEVNQNDDQSDEFYQQIIQNTLEWGGNTVDFVDENAPIDGYIVANEPDIPNPDGTLRKREEVYPAEILNDPEETAKLLRKFALKNADKLTQKGFYLGTWTDSVDVKDENGNVIEQREMLFLDVSEYVKDFNDALDKADEREEIAFYGVTEGESFYPKDHRQYREVFAERDRLRQEVSPEERKRLRDEVRAAEQRMNDVNIAGNVGPLKWVRDNTDWAVGLEPSEKERLSPEMYQAVMDWLAADKAYRDIDGDYYRAIFEMADGYDPGGRREGLYGRALAIRDKYVGDDEATLRMNLALREGGDVPSRAKEMDSLVNKSALKRDYVFFRGVWLDQGVIDEMNAGDTFYDRGFQSTAFDESDAQLYLSSRENKNPDPGQDKKARVVIRLVVPKGTNAINVGQGEVVLRRNTKMKIIRKSTGRYDGGDNLGIPRGVDIPTVYLDVLVEPQTKEEIDARTQGLVKSPQLTPNPSSSELFPDDGRGADGVGTPSPSQVDGEDVSGPTGDRGLNPIQYGAKKSKNISQRSATARANREQREKLQQIQEEVVNEEPPITQEQIEQAIATVRDATQFVPKSFSDLFDPNNPANILDAEIINSDIIGDATEGPSSNQVDEDELRSAKILFMRPNASWSEIDKALNESNSPIAKEILRLLGTKYAQVYAEAKFADEERKRIDSERKSILSGLGNVFDNLKTTLMADPNFSSQVRAKVAEILAVLQQADLPQGRDLFEQTNSGLIDTKVFNNLAAMSTDRNDPSYPKRVLDLVLLSSHTFKTNSNDPQKMREEMTNLVVDEIFGSQDRKSVDEYMKVFNNIVSPHGDSNSVPPLLTYLSQFQGQRFAQLISTFTDRYRKLISDSRNNLNKSASTKLKLASAVSDASREVLTAAGLEFGHGVTLSEQDINWHPPSEYEVSSDQTQSTHTPLPPDVVGRLSPELRTKSGHLAILNEALSRLPKPVALLMKKWIIDNKNSFSTNGGTRGCVAPSSPSFATGTFKHGDPIQNLRLNLQIDGATRQESVACAIHEMWHILVNYALPYQMGGLEWARSAALTQNVDSNGEVSSVLVDSNNGSSFVGNADSIIPADNRYKLIFNEVSAWSPEFVAPYVGKYGLAGGGLSRGSNPLATAEMMSALVETVLGGGIGGAIMSPTSGRADKIRAGFNEDGSPRYISYNENLISEGLLPAGITFVMLANELAKIKLGISNV